ncbi:MAG: murein L,D-transpeptidase catalytic domain family protein [Gammaproteobacteria bacterium]|nr:murein L,D-transpeptidase catalytic domain family protein [Gammaproteobacteria bacterium]MCW5582885.1 murein L,D-transpeptidase catalytic domain family protein [Gammaproteobacteria bacterium]
MKLKYILFTFALFGLISTSWSFSWLSSNSNRAPFGTNLWIKKEIQLLKSQAGNIDDKVLRLGLTAYLNARKYGYAGKQMLTVIDYSKPSTERRLWVFDLKSNRTLFNTWVSHGKNSGGVNSTSFSNHPGSLKSSIGVFLTDETYMGKNGYSLRLRGLEHGVNDSAYSRAIVIHGAAYANPANIKYHGRIGRSWGCPAVSSSLAKPIINTIKEKSVVFAYYPDSRWLSRSQFLSA